MATAKSKSSHPVDVWSVTTDVSTEQYGYYQSLLSPRERKRAQRFVFDKDRYRYTVATGMLRDVLAGYLSLDPRTLHFTYGEHGKPFLVRKINPQNIQFNLTHSANQILLAVTKEVEVGIDIERIRPDFAGLDIAQRFFAEAEYKALSALSGEQQVQAFFRGWTQKEAFIKAIGDGLSFPLKDFVVELTPGREAALLSIKQDSQAASQWSMLQLAVAEGYTAALAMQCNAIDINLKTHHTLNLL